MHGNRFNLHNKISVRDTIQMRHDESLQERMVRWREFFWSYRDYNDSVLLQAHKAKSFEKFAAMSQLPPHNQQVRMMAGVPAGVEVDDAVLRRAKENLCSADCVGILESMDSFVACMAHLFGKYLDPLPYTNVHTEAREASREITSLAREHIARNSWADHVIFAEAASGLPRRKKPKWRSG